MSVQPKGGLNEEYGEDSKFFVRLDKIVLNMGVGEAASEHWLIELP